MGLDRCKYCDEEIRFDSSGNGWVHEATHLSQCLPIRIATPSRAALTGEATT